MEQLIHSIGHGLQELGLLGYPLAVALMASVAVLPIPAEIPAAMNGMLFGLLGGVVVTWTGAMLGAWLSFELSQRYGRPFVQRVVNRRALQTVDSAVRTASWPGLLTARLIPAIAFTALNWGLGLTACRRRTFLWTTALGILPGTVVFVYSGEGLAKLYAANPLLAFLVAAVICSVVIVTASGRRAREGRRERSAAGQAPPNSSI